MTNQLLADICAEYAPYNTFNEFKEGFVDYHLGRVPAYGIGGVAGQAYDRGAEAAMRYARVTQAGYRLASFPVGEGDYPAR